MTAAFDDVRTLPSPAAGPAAHRLARPRRASAPSPSMPSLRDVVVCSFYTPDEYYSGHAARLRGELDALGLQSELLELPRDPGTDWADVTRRKIGFVRDVCRRNPDALVVWIDVDCGLSHLPDYIRWTTADFIGFQRSFASPLRIGYGNRARFWEPSFWGINATPLGRKLIEDAYALERRSPLKATDDYFLEEAWRANAAQITFQMVPTTAVVRRGLRPADSHSPFFSFGSSGNVAEFKNKVVQHAGAGGGRSARGRVLDRAKRIERSLPPGLRRSARVVADRAGITGWLTSDSYATQGLDRERHRLMGKALGAGMDGDREGWAAADRAFREHHVPTFGEASTLDSARAFLDYANRGPDAIRLAWWSKPFPGNFGDWLSPLIVASATDASIRLQSLTQPTTREHLVAVGSIGRFIRPSSVVVGTGISQRDTALAPNATYVSVRGPLTAQVLAEAGGPTVDAFGDPGILVSRAIPLERAATNGRVALVRHFSHLDVPLVLPPDVDELSVLMSGREDIHGFLSALVQYDAVLTSAMHVMIACHSYGIPCGLVTFEGAESNVHGTGIKYADYALGVGIPVSNPVVVPRDLRRMDLSSLLVDEKVSERTKDEIASHLRHAVALVGRSG